VLDLLFFRAFLHYHYHCNSCSRQVARASQAAEKIKTLSF